MHFVYVTSYIVLKFIARLTLISASSNGISLRILPNKVELVAGKWNVNFTCTIVKNAKNSQVNSSNLMFQFRTRSQPDDEDPLQIPESCMRRIDRKTLEMFHCPLIDENRSGTEEWLQCRLKHDENTLAEADITVKDPHIEPRMLGFEVNNWESLTVEFDTMENETRMFNMSFTIWLCNGSIKDIQSKCRMKEISGKKGNVTIEIPFNITSPSDDKSMSVKINGTARNYMNRTIETIETEEVRLNLNKFVKPAKVMNIEVLQSESSFTIAFKPPKLNRNITYNVLIECDRASFKYTENITTEIKSDDHIRKNDLTTDTSKGNSISHRFLGPLPFSRCNASVRAISVAGGKWNEWNTRSFETVEGVPLHNPQICSSCFSVKEGNFDSTFDVVVYFTPLSEETAQGKVVLYRIRILEKNTSKEHIENLNNTETNHFSFLLTNLSKQINYEIWIEAKTSKGFNHMLNNSNAIDVSFKARPSSPNTKSFVVLRLNSTAVRVSWEMNDNDCHEEKKVFLFWCEGNAHTKNCTNALQWRNVSSNLRSDIISAFSDDLMYGIGFECAGISSGILWTSCIHDLEGTPPKPKIHSIDTSGSSATVRFGDVSKCGRSTERPGLTVAYRIIYCEIPPTDSSVDGKCLNIPKKRILSKLEDRFYLSDLSHGHRYRISIQSVSENNRNSSFAVDFINIDSVISVSVIVAAVVSSGLLVFLTVTSIRLFHKCKAYFFDIKCDVPALVKPPDVIDVNWANSGICVNYMIPSYGPSSGDISHKIVDEFECPLSAKLVNELSYFENSAMFQPEEFPPDHFLVVTEPSPVVTIPSAHPDTFNCLNTGFEIDHNSEGSMSRILPSVCEALNKSGAENECETAGKEQQFQEDTTHELRQLSLEPPSPSDSAIGDYLCLGTSHPQTLQIQAQPSYNLERSSVPEDSGSGYIDGSARVVSVIQPPPSEPAQQFVEEFIDRFCGSAQDSAASDTSCAFTSPKNSIGIDCHDLKADLERDREDFYHEDGIDSDPRVHSEISEDDGIFMNSNDSRMMKLKQEANTSAEKYNRVTSTDFARPLNIDYKSEDADLKAHKLEQILPVCVPILDGYCSGYNQRSGSADCESHGSSEEVREFCATSEEYGERDALSYSVLSPMFCVDPFDSEFEDFNFTSGSILPSILPT